MKPTGEWIDLLSEDCPECGGLLKVRTQSCVDRHYYDGAPVRCTNCNFTSAISIDEDGYEWIQLW